MPSIAVLTTVVMVVALVVRRLNADCGGTVRVPVLRSAAAATAVTDVVVPQRR